MPYPADTTRLIGLLYYYYYYYYHHYYYYYYYLIIITHSLNVNFLCHAQLRRALGL